VPSFQLNPGVLVDAERGEAYVMSPDGGIVAVGLTDGAPVWRSSKAEKPLTLAGELLIGQAETPGPANALRIVTLDTGKRGEQVNEALVELPPGVQAMVGPSLNRSFTAEARAEPEEREEVAISWEFVERPLRGIPPGLIEVLPGEAPPAVSAAALPATGPATIAPTSTGASEPGGDAIIVRGMARIDLSTGTVTATEAARMPAAPGPPPVSAGDSAPASDLELGMTLPGVPQPQFLSADGRHVLSSQRIADDPEWDKYVWTIFERDSGRHVGELRAHLRYAPFFVSGARVICRTPPYERLQGPDMVQEPLQLRAVDLSTGAQVWSQPVRDTVDREPPPP
jgi:hypothetical protein